MDEVVVIIVGMALVTYIPRAIPMMNPIKAEFRFLRYVPVSLFAALVFPEILMNQENFIVFDCETVAGIVAFITAWKTRSLILTMVVGVLVLYLLSSMMKF